MAKHKYRWLPDLPDHRDLTFKTFHSLSTLPAKVDLRSLCSPIEDQGQLGSCTGNAIAGAIEFLDRHNGQMIDVSRLFIYYQERVIERSVNSDNGAMIRDGVKACSKVGVCLESLWPYNIKKFASKPTAASYNDAAKRKITQYRRVTGLLDFLGALAENTPVVFGFSVYESFESAAVARTGIMPYPKSSESLLGGHAVLAVGYDQATKQVIVRNSWGPKWGQKGYFMMPFDVILNRNMSDDFWVISK